MDPGGYFYIKLLLISIILILKQAYWHVQTKKPRTYFTWIHLQILLFSMDRMSVAQAVSGTRQKK